ncbi:MAG: flavodoxin domain-containing protein [Patescibacteria group bacterium]
MSKVLIVYATLGGNTELTVQKCQEELLKYGFNVKNKRVDVTSANELLEYDLTILASPTYGQGTVEQHFKPFLKSMKQCDYSRSKFAIIGLGDTKYYAEYLTESATVLEEHVKDLNGQIIVPALRIGMPPLKFINKLVPMWVDKISTKIKTSNPNVIGNLVS